jgi:hypothetical protein
VAAVGAIEIFLALAFPVFISVAIGITLQRAVTTLLMPRSVMPGLTIPVRNLAAISRPRFWAAPVTLPTMWRC